MSGLCSCSTSSGNGLGDLGDLFAGPDDLFALAVFGELDILVLSLSAFPDLHFAAATDDTHSHGAEQVVGRVAVHIDAAVEHGRGVLADTAVDHGAPTGVLLDEVGHIVDDPGHGNQTTSVAGLVLEVVPLHDGQGVERDTPVELRTLLVEFLLHLLHATFLDLVHAELLQIVRQTELFPDPDRPFRRVVLVPLNGIAIV